jgi:hypothetical protein
VVVGVRARDVPARLQRRTHARARVGERLDAVQAVELGEHGQVRDLGDQPAAGDAEPEAGMAGARHGG